MHEPQKQPYLRSEATEPLCGAPDSERAGQTFRAVSGWPKAETSKPRTQRRSLKQIHADLKELGYEGSYDRVAAYALGARMTQELTAQALWRAVRSKRPAPGLILHSDRGSQYCADDYRKLVAQFGMQASMSRKGNCYDNAPIESFWGSLKNEMIHHQSTPHGQTRKLRSRSTSKSSTIANGVIRAFVMYRQHRSQIISANWRWLLETANSYACDETGRA